MDATRALDKTAEMADEVIEALDELKLTERISIDRDTGRASIDIDDDARALFKDVKSTVGAAKKLYLDVQKIPRNAVTDRYLKFYRLIADNSKKVSQTIAKQFADAYWIHKVPPKVFQKGRAVVSFFVDAINGVLRDVNSRIRDKNYIIPEVAAVKWHSVAPENTERHQQQRYQTWLQKNRRDDSRSLTGDRRRAMFESTLLEFKAYRGYRNDPLWHAAGARPNENSKALYLAEKPSHAMHFAGGVTTQGAEGVVEEYEIPDDLKIYDAKVDAEGYKNSVSRDKDKLIDLLKTKGYDGYADVDRSVVAEDPFSTRLASESREYALFDREKYKPTKSFSTEGDKWGREADKFLRSVDKDYADERDWDEHQESMMTDADRMQAREWEIFEEEHGYHPLSRDAEIYDEEEAEDVEDGQLELFEASLIYR